MRYDLPSPENITRDAHDIEMCEPTMWHFDLRNSVEEERDSGFVWWCSFVFISVADGFGSFAIGEEACAEGGGELDQKYLRVVRVSSRRAT